MAATTSPPYTTATIDSSLHEKCSELSQPSCADRAAKLQVFSESVWDRLEQDPHPPHSLLSGFAALLQSPEDLLLVQLVIPDLRPAAPPPNNPIKQEIVRNLGSRQPQLEALAQWPRIRDTEASRQLTEETKVLQDAEIYRASILLSGHGNVSGTRRDRIRKWLLDFPKDDDV